MSGIGACPLRGHVDPRLIRFSAGATAATLVLVLLLVEVVRPLALGLLASQVAVLGFTAFVSFYWSVWAQLFARFVWPRLTSPAALVDARWPRRAQGFGLALAVPAFVCFAVASDVVGYLLVAACLAWQVGLVIRPTWARAA